MIIGKTENGQLVLDGSTVFSFYDQEGLPLSILFSLIKDRNFVIDFVGFFFEASKSWETRTIFKKLEEALVDSHNSDYCKVVLDRLILISEKLK